MLDHGWIGVMQLRVEKLRNAEIVAYMALILQL